MSWDEEKVNRTLELTERIALMAEPSTFNVIGTFLSISEHSISDTSSAKFNETFPTTANLPLFSPSSPYDPPNKSIPKKKIQSSFSMNQKGDGDIVIIAYM